MTGYELGMEGERYVATLLHQAGLRVKLDGPADLLLEGVPVEVKAARPSPVSGGQRQGYQFSLRRRARSGRVKTDHRRAALTILLCYYSEEQDPAAFIIPSRRLGDRKQISITSRIPWAYSGQWSGYLEAWEQAAPAIQSWKEATDGQ